MLVRTPHPHRASQVRQDRRSVLIAERLPGWVDEFHHRPGTQRHGGIGCKFAGGRREEELEATVGGYDSIVRERDNEAQSGRSPYSAETNEQGPCRCARRSFEELPSVVTQQAL